MRLRRWRVDGFGPLSNLDSGELDDRLIVIYGSNETGKSTLHEFLRVMLFAPWRGSGSGLKNPPLSGSGYGGELIIEAEQRRWTVSKQVRGNRTETRLIGPDGVSGDESTLQRLRGEIDANVFRNIFAIDLGILADRATLQESKVRDRIFSAGISGAGRSAHSAMAALEVEAAQWLRKRSKEGQISLRLAALSQLDSTVLEARREAEQLPALSEAERRCREEAEELQALRRTSEEQRGRLTRLEQIRRALDASQRSAEEAAQLGSATALELQAEEIDRWTAQLGERRLSAAQVDRDRLRVADLRSQSVALERSCGSAPIAADAIELPAQISAREQALREAEQEETAIEAEAARGETDLSGSTAALIGALAGIGTFVYGVAFALRWWALLGIGVAGLCGGIFWRSLRIRRQQRMQLQQRLDSSRKARELALAEWNGLVRRVGLEPPCTSAALYSRSSERRELQRLREEIERLERELAPLDRTLEGWGEAGATLAARLDRAWPRSWEERFHWCEALTRDRAREQERLRRRSDAEKRAESAQLEALRLSEPEQDSLIQEARSGSFEGWRREAERLEQERGELDRRLAAALEQVGAYKQTIQDLERSTRIADNELARQQLRAELAEGATHWLRASGARRLIESTLQRYEQTHQPEVLRHASTLFEQLTAGRWSRIAQSEQDGLIVSGTRGSVDPVALSRGTQEQLYLSLRIGLAAHLESLGAQLPFMFDDLLVNFDPERRSAAARMLASLCRQRQVLVFTCHPEIVALLKSETELQLMELG